MDDPLLMRMRRFERLGDLLRYGRVSSKTGPCAIRWRGNPDDSTLPSRLKRRLFQRRG